MGSWRLLWRDGDTWEDEMKRLVAFISIFAPALGISTLALIGPSVLLLLLGFISFQDPSGLVLVILALVLVPGIFGIIIA